MKLRGLRRGRHPGTPVQISEVALNEVYLLLGGEFVRFVVRENLPLEEPEVLLAGPVESGQQLNAHARKEQPGEIRGEHSFAATTAQVHESINR